MLEPLFSVRGLRKVFGDGTEALAGVDLDIREGECLVIAGSNGSGKSVLMRILLGLIEATEGELRFRGGKPGEAGAAARRAVGLVFQDADAQILGDTVEDDVAFGPRNLGMSSKEVSRRVEAALVDLDLTEKRESPPRRLSGGEKRRLAVAGVLAMGCEAVALDEPFANLDWPGVVQVLRGIEALKAAGRTVVVLTHELEKVLALADRLAILHRGRIRDEGRPEVVLDRLEAEYGIRDPRRRYDTVQDCSWLA